MRLKGARVHWYSTHRKRLTRTTFIFTMVNCPISSPCDFGRGRSNEVGYTCYTAVYSISLSNLASGFQTRQHFQLVHSSVCVCVCAVWRNTYGPCFAQKGTRQTHCHITPQMQTSSKSPTPLLPLPLPLPPTFPLPYLATPHTRTHCPQPHCLVRALVSPADWSVSWGSHPERGSTPATCG